MTSQWHPPCTALDVGVCVWRYQLTRVQTKAQLDDVKVGAFVSVECEGDSPRCTAVKLVVVRPSQP
jgi:hypothetical protein